MLQIIVYDTFKLNIVNLVSFVVLIAGIATVPAWAEELIPFEGTEKKYHNMDSELAGLYEEHIISPQELSVTSEQEHRVQVILEMVDIGASVPQNLGIEVEATYEELVQATVPISNLGAISNDENVNLVMSPSRPQPASHGSGIISEGTYVIGSDLFNEAGYAGDGIKVAVIDTGFDIYNSEIYGNIVEYRSFDSVYGIEGDNIEHGTASAEIVVDMAPDVELYLYNFETNVEFYNLVDYLIERGDIDIITMSLIWVHGPFDGTSRISQTVAEARNNGILWVNAAGNYANAHWQGTFTDTDGDGWHNFASSDETIEIDVYAGRELRLTLSWWGFSEQDYDLYLYEGTNMVASSDNLQPRFPPYEYIGYTPQYDTTLSVKILKYSSDVDADLKLFAYDYDLKEYAVPESSIAIPADSSNVLSVGATHWENDILEDYSSRGPTADGRIKPDVTAPTCVTTDVYDDYCGTSSSTPHVAGAAALLMEAYPSATADDIQEMLESNTSNYHTKSNRDGTGIVSLAKLVPDQSPPVTTPTAPTGLRATADHTSVTLSWTAPDNTGGHPITDYIVEYRPTDGQWNTFPDGTSTDTTTMVTSLTNDTEYDFRVKAENLVGVGPASDIISATPMATLSPEDLVTLNISAFSDDDNDGVWDAGEAALPGTIVLTYVPATDIADLLVTGADGTISKTDLTPHTFYVIALPPEDMIVTTHPYMLGVTTYNGVLFVENPASGSTHSMEIGVKSDPCALIPEDSFAFVLLGCE